MSDWTAGNDDGNEWNARRAAFRGGGILRYTVGAAALSTEGAKRNTIVDAMEACGQLGSGNDPPGRRKSYEEVCFPFDSNPGQVHVQDSKCSASSCGTFIRGIWSLLGAGTPKDQASDRKFRCDYKGGVLRNLPLYAQDFGGLVGRADGIGFVPPNRLIDMKKGDCCYFGTDDNKQHIFTFMQDAGAPYAREQGNGAEQTLVYVAEGGQATSDEDGRAHKNGDDIGCHRVALHSRILLTDGQKIFYRSQYGTYTMRYWISLAAIPFNDLPIVPQP